MLSLLSVRIAILLCAFAVSVASGGTETPQQQDSRSAAKILALMAQTYHRCKTYSDSGVVKTIYIEQSGRTRTVETRFTTAFVRPDRFRFEYVQHTESSFGAVDSDRYIVWQQGKEVRTWWNIEPGVHNEPSLGYALARNGGASDGSAYNIPDLLLPEELGGDILSSFKRATRLEDARLGETVCFRIHGQWVGDPVTIWIDSKAFLIQRIDSGHIFDDFHTEVSTTYDAPAVNGPISEEKLAFAAPRQK